MRQGEYIYEAIRRALMDEWDPIGVSEIAEAQDEYDSYVVPIYKMLKSGKSPHEVFDYLWWLETEWMGLAGDRQATKKVADRLMMMQGEIEQGKSR